MNKRFGFLLVFLLAIYFSGRTQPKGNSAHAPSNALWTSVLKKYVNQNGLINYKGLLKDRNELNQYLSLISSNPPSDSWSANEKKAYWINAYNAFTVKLILEHYPVKTIKDIGPSIQIPFVNTPWEKKFFKIGGVEMKLDEIEHSILRKKFNDPRIHFTLVCAAKSCPKLRTEAYDAAILEHQLEDQGKVFLADKSKNIITPNKLRLSKIFSWYKSDFTLNNKSLIDFLNNISFLRINKNAEIVYLDYDWNLNEQ